MTEHAAIDATDFPRNNSDQRHPLWWGVLGLITIELTVVAGFIVSYFYLRMGPPEWPPDGLEPPPLLWETLNTALLIASAAAIGWAGRGIARGSDRVLVIGLALAILLDSLVLVFRWLQFEAFTFRWDEHAYGSIVWTITGFHFVHVASAILGTAAIEVLALKGFWNEDRKRGVVIDTMYWYFVSFAWIPFYLTLYWTERVL